MDIFQYLAVGNPHGTIRCHIRSNLRLENAFTNEGFFY